MNRIKKKNIFCNGYFVCKEILDGVIEAKLENKDSIVIGIFGVKDYSGYIELNVDDGIYVNEIDEEIYEISSGKINYKGNPVILETKSIN